MAEVQDESTHERDLEVLGSAIRIVQKESWAEEGAVVAAWTRLTTTKLENAIAEAKAQVKRKSPVVEASSPAAQRPPPERRGCRRAPGRPTCHGRPSGAQS